MEARTEASSAVDFLVHRRDLRRCRFEPAAGPDEVELAPGQLLLGVDRFAFTSNNIS